MIIFFEWNSADLTGPAPVQIAQAVTAARVRGTRHLTVRGHTDASGAKPYNLALSLRRAEAVKAALVERGIPADTIAVQGLGDSQPLVPTRSREPQNRRVTVDLD